MNRISPWLLKLSFPTQLELTKDLPHIGAKKMSCPRPRFSKASLFNGNAKSSFSTASLNWCLSWILSMIFKVIIQKRHQLRDAVLYYSKWIWRSKSTAKQSMPCWSRDSYFTLSPVASCTIFFKGCFPNTPMWKSFSRKPVACRKRLVSNRLSVFLHTNLPFHIMVMVILEVNRNWQKSGDDKTIHVPRIELCRQGIRSRRLHDIPICRCDPWVASHLVWRLLRFGRHRTRFHPKGWHLDLQAYSRRLCHSLNDQEQNGVFVQGCPRSNEFHMSLYNAVFTTLWNHFSNQAQPQLARLRFCSQSCSA